ncbi:uncharacterized protein ARB_06664 [Trichophyton benhamiae CBS 112371]|uniref:Uncharacterized protein n=1 Tax=Arthroderma benhamiae (strain ATCC MYA-4681 / CBS 112371) TaxID=663331 RepID=D4ARC4_ARTBC|nr:uncharacterized protein ARB_06664 [Trichophyton benhamiae CBS 112371]EFE34267.1 hypothetical protein ARB_06664 [Trichophyton benhamiae CBS 112371]
MGRAEDERWNVAAAERDGVSPGGKAREARGWSSPSLSPPYLCLFNSLVTPWGHDSITYHCRRTLLLLLFFSSSSSSLSSISSCLAL